MPATLCPSAQPTMLPPGVRVPLYLLYATTSLALYRTTTARLPILRMALCLLISSTFLTLLVNANSAAPLDWLLLLCLSSEALLMGDVPLQGLKLYQAYHRRRKGAAQDAAILDAVFMFSHTEHAHLTPLVSAAISMYRDAACLEAFGTGLINTGPLFTHRREAQQKQLQRSFDAFKVLAKIHAPSVILAPVIVPFNGTSIPKISMSAISGNFMDVAEAAGFTRLDALSIDALLRRTTGPNYRDPEDLLQRDVMSESFGLIQPLSKAGASAMYALFGILLLCLPWLFFQRLPMIAHANCDVKVLFFTPVSVYNPQFSGFLKFCSVIAAIVGFILLVTGIRMSIMHLQDLSNWFALYTPWRPDVFPPFLIPENRPPKNVEIHREMQSRKQSLQPWQTRFLKALSYFSLSISLIIIIVTEVTVFLNKPTIVNPATPFTTPAELTHFLIGFVCCISTIIEAILIARIKHADFAVILSAQKPPHPPFFPEDTPTPSTPKGRSSSPISPVSTTFTASTIAIFPASTSANSMPASPAGSLGSYASIEEMEEDTDQLGAFLPKRVSLEMNRGGWMEKTVAYPTSFRKTRGRVPLRAPPRPVRTVNRGSALAPSLPISPTTINGHVVI